MRVGELGLVHRHELSGALHGLMRVRCFTQDDAHIFMREDQMIDEIHGVIDLTTSVYDVFGFKYSLELSTRPDNAMGSDGAWEMATDTLREALNRKDCLTRSMRRRRFLRAEDRLPSGGLDRADLAVWHDTAGFPDARALST